MRRLGLIAFVLMTIVQVIGVANAHEFAAGSMNIEHPWSRATPSGAKTGGAYLIITNNGTEADTLISITTEAAERSEFHSMSMAGDVMKMEKITEPLVILPNQKLAFEPQGNHIMLFDLKAVLKEGASFKGTLTFEKAGPVEIEFKVNRLGAKAPSAPKSNNGTTTGEGHKGMNHSGN